MAVTLRIVIHRTKARDAVGFARAQHRKIDVRRLNVGGTLPRLKLGSLAEFKHIAAGHLPKTVAALQGKRYRRSAPFIKRRLRRTKLGAEY
jgi:hypothetical protein